MTKTKSGLTSAVVAACLLGLGLYALPKLTTDPDDRIITLATAWGRGGGEPRSAYMQFQVGPNRDHEIKGGGHWERLVHGRKGDHVVLTIMVSSPNDMASCSVHVAGGATVTGSVHCEILALP